ncbi:uroporphyrinogen-III synthase [Priestia flexa]|jgi:uroporphyrinogen-III synthase|uniref:Uroporphyrinogen-III synthase n=1 Tax=Priestia flexa TaxID=86664 RepID=A0A1N6SG85_9BACI|nr:uroporphyrinogen-III synthase [Priestia flexa]AQX53588.1 uroporphyrinogen III synthase [Priestia flexa]MBN8250592.1 uroporphyrinogen-III synthase [Priestia flexa]MBN8432586.1 uroporphyrinogen-III synthase [Priestia flexa]MBY6085312.1 uroporphyrinogen-III synthase [Priestia flexa]MCA0965429.1 uroporphyrinogen-III synthase [Priestia flexa]
MSQQAPLFLKRVLITRQAEQAKSFTAAIQAVGGIPLTVPVLSFVPAANRTYIQRVLEQLHTYQWIIFTSQNGVEFFFQWLNLLNINSGLAKSCKIAVVGKKTGEALKKRGIKPDVTPEEYIAESLLEALMKEAKPHEKVLVVRGNLARPILLQGLDEKGYSVTDLVMYETVQNKASRTELQHAVEKADIITFTSSSTVNFFVDMMDSKQDWLSVINEKVVVCIGPITAQTAAKYEIEHIVPEEYTINGMIEKMVDYFKGNN